MVAVARVRGAALRWKRGMRPAAVAPEQLALQRTSGRGIEMGTAAKATTNHERIRQWVESRGGHPAAIKATGGKDDVGIIRIDFPGYSGEGKLEPIGWDEFFKKFEESQLAFIYQETTSGGQQSRFNKLVKRETVEEEE